jgi:hypothetical protein
MVERAFREFLERHLPRSLSVGHGEVVDMHGNRSAQSDVVVLNEDQPLGLAGPSSDPGVFIIEGVSAVGEVKSVLTKSSLDDAIRKGAQLKSLRVQELGGSEYHGPVEDANRFGVAPPFFVMAFEASIADATLFSTLVDSPMVGPSPSINARGVQTAQLPALDGLFVLGTDIAVVHTGQNQGAITAGNASDYPWAKMQRNSPLTAFLFWLHSTMPRWRRRGLPSTQYLRKFYFGADDVSARD